MRSGEFLPDFQIVGLCGWDDFIVRDKDGRIYSVPAVPMELQYLKTFSLPGPTVVLEPADENMTWVIHDKHAQLRAMVEQPRSVRS